MTQIIVFHIRALFCDFVIAINKVKTEPSFF